MRFPYVHRERLKLLDDYHYSLEAHLRLAWEREVSALEKRLDEQRAAFLDWRDRDWREIEGLRHGYAELLDRVTDKLKLVPAKDLEPKTPLTTEELQDRSRKIDGIRRTGPVAKSQQEAEAVYYAELEKQEQLRKLDPDKR